MTNSINNTGSINDITNLKFYTGKGYEIPMQKSYVLTWELIPGEFASQYIKSPIMGYFIGDIDFDDPTQLRIKPGTLEVSFINLGEIYIRFATQRSIDKNGMPVFAYDEVDEHNLLPADLYYDYLHAIFLRNDNQIKIAINVKNKSYTHVFNINEIFTLEGDDETYQDYTTVKTIYTGENLAGNLEFYQTIGISKINLITLEDDSDVPYIQQVFEDNVPNIGVYFPFVRYAGDFYQDKVSENFIAADTILVLEEIRNEDDSYSYVRPYINADSEYSLVFQPSTNSELKIIDSASTYNIIYKDSAAFTMANSLNEKANALSEPFSFAIAFLADTEGAYQNLLGIYLKSLVNENIVFFMGAISVKSEVEGEDERFRTLLTNFGVPDPVNYSNLFAELDYQEETKDYKLINKKSKELMLSYDLIFSYVGTYKALFKAIKFLGYQDIVFKEWYTVRDHNDKLTDIAVLVFDSSTGSFLKLKLADVGVSIEDFKNYNKINKISMIYHFNELSDEVEKIKTTLSKYDESQGKIISITDAGGHPITRTKITEVPMTRPIFIYRNEEIFAKLFAVKLWLEQHIIGVGAYISDITGEGIYFGWQKTQGYLTEHYLNDFSLSLYYTADIKEISEFKDSSAIVTSTLNELNNAVRFIDYEDTPIVAFDKYDISINLHTDDGVYIDASVLTISNSIEAPVLGDEYEFDLVVKPKSGTLYEWTSKDSSAQILMQDGEIKLLYDNDIEAFIDLSYLPIITLENANIHSAFGNWRDNLKWYIREAIDPETGNTQYVLKNYREFVKNSSQKVVNQYIIIEPDIKTDPETGEIIDMPYIKYSEKNKWDIPMFIIHGYKFANIDIDSEAYKLDDVNSDFVLEILKGDMLFKDIDHCGCQVAFTTDSLKSNNVNGYTNELEIQPIYTYHSERKPFVLLNSKAILEDTDTTIQCEQILNDITNMIRNELNEIYTLLLNTYSEYLPSIPIMENIAYKEAFEYLFNSTDLHEEIMAFINAKLDAKKKELLDAYLQNIISENYTCNHSIDTSVSRLGEYEIIARAFDKYNNIFVSKYDNTVNVMAAPIEIKSYTTTPNSNNDLDFYKYNINGEQLDEDACKKLIYDFDASIFFPKSYHIYEIDYNLENDYVEFDNISYAIDTPKNNDIVIFDTLTERCVDCNKIGGYIKLCMLDENPDKQFLYSLAYVVYKETDDSSDGELSENEFINLVFNSEDKLKPIQKYVSVFAYDVLTKQIYTLSDHKIVQSSNKVDLKDDINYEADSYIITDVPYVEITNHLRKNHKIYVLDSTEYPIYIDDPSIETNIEYDNENRKTYVYFSGEQIFNKEDVIKFRYCMDTSVCNTFTIYDENEKTLDTSIISSTTTKQIINETAYRIIDVYNDIDDETKDFITYTYVIDGLPNRDLINNEYVKTYIMRVALHPVRYSTKVLNDAYEFNDMIGFDNYSIIRDHFIFNSSNLFLNDYIDDSYGIEVNDYDYVDGYKYWANITYWKEYADEKSMNIYSYLEFPLTLEQDDKIIFNELDKNGTFKKGYKKEWRVLVLSVDEYDNADGIINNNRKETLFRSINDYLTIAPYMLGSHDIELTCTDVYGNRLVNKGEGLLYVKENPNKEYRNYSYI